MDKKGFSLIEMLIALAISAILIATFFRSIISQQKSSSIQDQVVDVRQNIRAGLDRMMREIRMAGYGGNVLETFGSVNSFSNIITPVNNGDHDSITIITAAEVAKLNQASAAGSTLLTLSVGNANEVFNAAQKRYLCLNGQNNYVVSSTSGNTVTLSTALQEDHLDKEPVFLVKAITYKILPNTTNLIRDENAGEIAEVLAEGVESMDCRYTLSNGSVADSPATPSEIRIVSVSAKARTKMADPEYLGEADGYRRQTLTADVKVRNLGL